MESFNLIVTGSGSSDQEVCYSASLKVPQKAELLDLLPIHLDKIVHNLKFQTGPLAGVKHKLILCLYRECNDPKLGIFISVEKQPDKQTYFKLVTATVLLTEERIRRSELGYGCTLTRSTPPKNWTIDPDLQEWYESQDNYTNDFWKLEERWHEDATMVILMFHVVGRKPPKIINKEEEELYKGNEMNGHINISSFFLNKDLSDFTLICNSTKFPVHRLILSSRVKFFEKLFNNDMKESREGYLKLNDMDPSTLTELLRFIYQGRIEDLPTHATELYIISDKYGMDDLKRLCERQLYNNIDVENALAIYDLAEMHGSPNLSKRAKEVILSNKSRFARDAETLKNFTCKYPELVFQLFMMEL